MKAAKVLSIARREYIARVRSKGFIITTLMVPAMMAIYAVILPAMTRADVDELRITVVDAGTGIGAALTTRLSETRRLPFVMQQTETVAARQHRAAASGCSTICRSFGRWMTVWRAGRYICSHPVQRRWSVAAAGVRVPQKARIRRAVSRCLITFPERRKDHWISRFWTNPVGSSGATPVWKAISNDALSATWISVYRSK